MNKIFKCFRLFSVMTFYARCFLLKAFSPKFYTLLKRTNYEIKLKSLRNTKVN